MTVIKQNFQNKRKTFQTVEAIKQRIFLYWFKHRTRLRNAKKF